MKRTIFGEMTAVGVSFVDEANNLLAAVVVAPGDAPFCDHRLRTVETATTHLLTLRC
ncbi:MAG TPA: hypothetical protein VGJ05_06185 [Fimbriiglobus sp.]|jgi:hypothetical protein